VIDGNSVTGWFTEDLATAAGLKGIAKYADGVGPNKGLLIPRDANNTLGAPTTFVEDAHAAGLVVHPWTFRRENTFLPKDYQQGNPASPEFPRAIGDAPGEFARSCGSASTGSSATTPTSRSRRGDDLRPTRAHRRGGGLSRPLDRFP
jgi:glycerophosphoryl diester phosphodiesterase